MKNSVLSKCGFRDDEFAKFFISLQNSEINSSESAAILRQIFGEVMAGVSSLEGDTGFRPISLSGKRSIGSLWNGFGGSSAVEAISIEALHRGAKVSKIKAFLRAYRGEKLVSGVFIPASIIVSAADKLQYDNDGEPHRDGKFSEDGRLVSYMGHRTHRVGRAYFLEGSGWRHLPGSRAGSMWTK